MVRTRVPRPMRILAGGCVGLARSLSKATHDREDHPVNESDAVSADALVAAAMAKLRLEYPSQRFNVERDVVWTVQRWLAASAAERGWRVWNDYPMVKGPRRALSADLAITGDDGLVLCAVEFKYEPSPSRSDVQRQKLPVIDWRGAAADSVRIADWVGIGRSATGWAVCIDEGNVLHRRGLAIPGGEWQSWGTYGGSELDVWVHVHRVSAAVG